MPYDFFNTSVPNNLRAFLGQTRAQPNGSMTTLEQLQNILDQRSAAGQPLIRPNPALSVSRVNPNGTPYGMDPIGDRSSFQQLDDEAANTWPAPRYGGPPDSLGQTSNEQRIARLSVPQPPPMPQRGLPGSSGTANGNQGLMAIASLLGIPQASGTVNQSKAQDRLPATPTLLAYNGETGPMVPLPRIRPTPPGLNVPLPRIRPQPPMNMGATNLAPPGVSGVLDPTFPVDNSIPLNLPQPPANRITVNGGTSGRAAGGSAPVPPPPAGVRLASGKTVPVGTTGTAQGGRYQYQVQSDGSVRNLTTGRYTAPPTRR